MRRKQILIGLFVLIIWRTIGEPKSPQGGRERAFVLNVLLRAVTGVSGKFGVVTHGRLRAFQCQWVDISPY